MSILIAAAHFTALLNKVGDHLQHLCAVSVGMVSRHPTKVQGSLQSWGEEGRGRWVFPEFTLFLKVPF